MDQLDGGQIYKASTDFILLKALMESLPPDQPLSPEHRENARLLLDDLSAAVNAPALDHSRMAANEFSAKLLSPIDIFPKDIGVDIEDVSRTLRRDLVRVPIFRLSFEEWFRYSSIISAFSFEGAAPVPVEIEEDLRESGRAWAFSLYTATVFHIMRALEWTLKDLAAREGIALDPRDTWANFIDKIAKQAKVVGDTTSKGKGLNRVAADLGPVRTAWRNETMHPAASYNKMEASEVINSARYWLLAIYKSKNP